MKYLVNRTTKEHRIAGKDWQDTDTDYWRVVQADDDGWIKHTGNECPLPGDVRCEITEGDWKSEPSRASHWSWVSVSRYRPIIADIRCKSLSQYMSHNTTRAQCRLTCSTASKPHMKRHSRYPTLRQSCGKCLAVWGMTLWAEVRLWSLNRLLRLRKITNTQQNGN